MLPRLQESPRPTALLLASRGAKVVVGARRADRLKVLVAGIGAARGEAAFTAVDVKRRDDLVGLVPSPARHLAGSMCW